MKTKHYFLFGSDACQELFHEGKAALLSWCKDNKGMYGIFCFTDGETSPSTLLDCFEGWGEYTAITEELYKKILVILIPS